MGRTTDQAVSEVAAARQALGVELDELGSAARSAVDIPAKIKKHPGKTMGLATGAAFLAVGGPKRLLKSVERRVRPSRADRLKGLLPKDVERSLDRLGDNAEQVRANLEADFVDFVNKRNPKTTPPTGRQSLWKTYDVLVGPVGGAAAKRLVERLFAAEGDRPSGRSGRS